MCVVIVAPPGVMIPGRELIQACEQNPDGAGYAFAYQGQLVMDRSATDTDRICEQFDKFQAEHPMCYGMFHARIATQGTCIDENTHPFQVPGKPWALMHNGIMPLSDGPWGNRSDTRILAEDHVSRMTWPQLRGRKAETEKWLRSNKVVLLSAHKERGGRCLIFNEDLGHWSTVTKCWYSRYLTSQYSWQQGTGGGTRGAPNRRHGSQTTTRTQTTTTSPSMFERGPGGELKVLTQGKGTGGTSGKSSGVLQRKGSDLAPNSSAQRKTAAETWLDRLDEAASLLNVEADDLRSWAGHNYSELVKLVDEILDGTTWDTNDTQSPDAQETDHQADSELVSPSGLPIILGEWDDDHTLYYADNGRVYRPEPRPGQPDRIVPVSTDAVL